MRVVKIRGALSLSLSSSAQGKRSKIGNSPILIEQVMADAVDRYSRSLLKSFSGRQDGPRSAFELPSQQIMIYAGPEMGVLVSNHEITGASDRCSG